MIWLNYTLGFLFLNDSCVLQFLIYHISVASAWLIYRSVSPVHFGRRWYIFTGWCCWIIYVMLHWSEALQTKAEHRKTFRLVFTAGLLDVVLWTKWYLSICLVCLWCCHMIYGAGLILFRAVIFQFKLDNVGCCLQCLSHPQLTILIWILKLTVYFVQGTTSLREQIDC